MGVVDARPSRRRSSYLRPCSEYRIGAACVLNRIVFFVGGASFSCAFIENICEDFKAQVGKDSQWRFGRTAAPNFRLDFDGISALISRRVSGIILRRISG